MNKQPLSPENAAEPVVTERDKACAEKLCVYLQDQYDKMGDGYKAHNTGIFAAIIAKNNAEQREEHLAIVQELQEMVNEAEERANERGCTITNLQAQLSEAKERLMLSEARAENRTRSLEAKRDELEAMEKQLAEAKKRVDGLLLIMRSALAFTVPMNKMFSDAVSYCNPQPATPSEG